MITFLFNVVTYVTVNHTFYNMKKNKEKDKILHL